MEPQASMAAIELADRGRNQQEIVARKPLPQRSRTAASSFMLLPTSLNSRANPSPWSPASSAGQRAAVVHAQGLPKNGDPFCSQACDTVSKHMKPTRRVFLAASAVTPRLITAIQPAAQALAQETRTNLKTAMDLIIPASDRMPSATEAGGLAYLERLMQQDKDVAEDVAKALTVADAFSQRAFQRSFRDLQKQEQIAVLKEMENSTGDVFDRLRAYVYESYYEQPAIWKLIAYENYPTDHMGPHLAPFDDSLVANVRKMPKLYRDV